LLQTAIHPVLTDNLAVKDTLINPDFCDEGKCSFISEYNSKDSSTVSGEMALNEILTLRSELAELNIELDIGV